MTLVKFGNNLSKGNALNPLLSDVFESFFNDSFVSDRMVSRVPAVNIGESDKEYHIELAAPGLEKNDFKINLEKNLLSINVEKRTENTESQEAKKYNKREFSYTSFVRTFTLPESASYEDIQAEYIDGILKINVPKKEEAIPQTREINIK
ncbi:MAG: Hsp20/alpha crystallin family protein [Sphingobacteriales bacterium]|nr:Hsp20/alpha crystallin family protein [Sphingobacteriales bacterium]